MNTLVIAYYTAKKYLRNILTMVVFVLAPILVMYVLTGSTEYNFTGDPMKSAAVVNSQSNLNVAIVEPAKGTLSMNDKISIDCMLIFLFYGCLLITYAIINDLKKNTHIRIKSSSVNMAENIIGKSAGCICILSISTVVIVLISKYMLHVKWIGNLGMVFLSFILFFIIVNSFGIIITAFSKNIYICALFAFAVNFAMVFPVMVETFSPVKSEALGFIRKISFHNYTSKSIIGAMNGDAILLHNSFIVLIAIAAVMFCISLLVGRRVLK